MGDELEGFGLDGEVGNFEMFGFGVGGVCVTNVDMNSYLYEAGPGT